MASQPACYWLRLKLRKSSAEVAEEIAININETLYWVESLLPGETTVVRRQVSDSFPEFHIAVTHLGNGEGTNPTGAHGSTHAAAPDETISMSIDFARVDPGLVAEDGSDVRAELIFVNSGHSGVGADLIACAATMVSQNAEVLPPQPGTTLPDLAGHVDGSITARHGVFVVPFVWEQGVPNVHEVADEPGGRHAQPVEASEAAPEFTHPGRLTVVTQLVMLTDEEFAIAESDGLAAAQRFIVENAKNLHDLWRS